VSDNGIGKPAGKAALGGGLGTTIVKALAGQLDARVEVASDGHGMSTAITRATFTSTMPLAA